MVEGVPEGERVEGKVRTGGGGKKGSGWGEMETFGEVGCEVREVGG